MKKSSCSACTGGTASVETNILMGKGVVAAASLYLLYIGVTCPCAPELYSCHLTQLYLAVIIIVAVMIYFNGLRFQSYTK